MNNTATTKRKGSAGRPTLTDDQRRCLRVQPSFTLTEFEELEARAKAFNQSVSDWLRTAGLGITPTIRPVPAVNRQAYSELARLSGNINQLTALANGGGIVHGGSLADLLNQTAAQVQALRRELIGGTS